MVLLCAGGPPLREGVDLNFQLSIILSYQPGLPLREGVDLNISVYDAGASFAVSLCVREWI